ncbi:MAG: DUF222 domain-containing protein [Steroidobacteraceae bacterium]|nr:DUF222 domain-containing protein [Steroidobacteraceae bacterium]
MDGKPQDQSARTLAQLEAEITELAGHLNAAQHRWLVLIAEFDRRNGWAEAGCLSCAHWLNFKCGIALGAAREKVRVAHALEQLPKISAAMSRGELSYSKVRALTRIACPETEDTLLMIALHGTAHHVERIVQQFRRAKEAEELSREAQQYAGRCFSYFHDSDGSLVLKARLPADVGALVIKALDAAVNEMHAPDVPAETGSGRHAGADSSDRPSWAVQRADALGVLAESFLKHGAQSLSGGERQQIIVHVDATTLRDGTAGRCEIEHGPSLPAETARRLACDSAVVRLLEDKDGEPLNVGRRTRSIPPALRRALQARDRGCRFPGCTHTRFVDAHHVQHWAQGGETRASNLVLLCRRHHRFVHEGGVQIQVLDDGAFRFVKPDGQTLDSVPPQRPSAWTQLAIQHEQAGLTVHPGTAVTRWSGESVDYGLAVGVLLAAAKRGVPAATAHGDEVPAETRHSPLPPRTLPVVHAPLS